MKKYKVELVQEGAFGTLFFGSSKVSITKLESILNQRAQEGWQLDFMVIEKRRLGLFWQRESVLITLSKET
jgi:hypothetical protein